MAALVGIGHAVVAATLRNGYRGHYTTVQAAIDAGETLIYLKAGQTVAGWNQNQNAVEVEAGPGVTVTSDINITGHNCALIGGPGFTVQGEIDVTTGVEAFIELQNGGALQNLDINTARCYVNGGGWGTVASAAMAYGSGVVDSRGGSHSIVENIAAVGVAGVEAYCYYPGASDVLRLVKASSAPHSNIRMNSADVLVLGAYESGALSRGLRWSDVGRQRTIGCYSGSATYEDGTPDDAIILANILYGGDGGNGGFTNCVVVGNRISGSLAVQGSTTYAANDETAF